MQDKKQKSLNTSEEEWDIENNDKANVSPFETVSV